jgi:hypothetical protein
MEKVQTERRQEIAAKKKAAKEAAVEALAQELISRLANIPNYSNAFPYYRNSLNAHIKWALRMKTVAGRRKRLENIQFSVARHEERAQVAKSEQVAQ